ncbi:MULTISPECIES: S24 family peptidase [unclassified Acidovorax]|uniref:S24 family peptidase n=2 Tax=unclassified Acidovorax TaxID=2684926 RepID=UPI002882DD2B|nr:MULTISPECIES: S24 family peptidase [unclassified Acidovorax]
MDDMVLQTYRRQRLKAAIDRLTNGNIAAFGRLVGYRDGAFVRQMLSGSRVVSEKTVRAVEALRGMDGWFAAVYAYVPAHASEAVATYRVARDGIDDAAMSVALVKLSLVPGKKGFESVREHGAAEGEDAAGACFPRGWLKRRGYRAEDLIALRVQDESMRPSLHPRDVITVNTALTQPLEGRVYLVNDEGACLIRRLVRDKGAWWLTADDALRHPRKELVSPNALLIGQVVHMGSESL